MAECMYEKVKTHKRQSKKKKKLNGSRGQPLLPFAENFNGGVAMQIKNVTYGMTYRMYKNYRECLNMIECLRNLDKSKIVKEKIKIMNFYEKYGEKATKEAFGADRKLISKWRKRIKDNNGNLQALIPISTKPDKFRTSTTDYKIIEEIKRIRQEYYRLGKYKVKVFLDEYCIKEGLKTISASTIGLIIKRNNMFYQPKYNLPIHRNYTRNKTRIMVKYSQKVKEPGTIVADTVVVRQEGITRFFYNAIDVSSKFAFSYYFDKQTSKNMVAFYEMFKKVYPYKIKQWQNDNGHENLGDFEQKLKKEKIKQVFSYPRCPKINAYIERFNRTLREEFIDVNGVLIKEKEEFDNLLINWLVYYNSKRPHLALNLKAPLQYMSDNYKMSLMCLTNTKF